MARSYKPLGQVAIAAANVAEALYTILAGVMCVGSNLHITNKNATTQKIRVWHRLLGAVQDDAHLIAYDLVVPANGFLDLKLGLTGQATDIVWIQADNTGVIFHLDGFEEPVVVGRSYKPLGQGKIAVANTPQDLYTVPASTQAVSSNLQITNKNGTSQKVRVWHRAAGVAAADKHLKAYDVVVPANGTISLESMTMATTDKITVQADNTGVVFCLYGFEEPV